MANFGDTQVCDDLIPRVWVRATVRSALADLARAAGPFQVFCSPLSAVTVYCLLTPAVCISLLYAYLSRLLVPRLLSPQHTLFPHPVFSLKGPEPLLGPEVSGLAPTLDKVIIPFL